MGKHVYKCTARFFHIAPLDEVVEDHCHMDLEACTSDGKWVTHIFCAHHPFSQDKEGESSDFSSNASKPAVTGVNVVTRGDHHEVRGSRDHHELGGSHHHKAVHKKHSPWLDATFSGKSDSDDSEDSEDSEDSKARHPSHKASKKEKSHKNSRGHKEDSNSDSISESKPSNRSNRHTRSGSRALTRSAQHLQHGSSKLEDSESSSSSDSSSDNRGNLEAKWVSKDLCGLVGSQRDVHKEMKCSDIAGKGKEHTLSCTSKWRGVLCNEKSFSPKTVKAKSVFGHLQCQVSCNKGRTRFDCDHRLDLGDRESVPTEDCVLDLVDCDQDEVYVVCKHVPSQILLTVLVGLLTLFAFFTLCLVVRLVCFRSPAKESEE